MWGGGGDVSAITRDRRRTEKTVRVKGTHRVCNDLKAKKSHDSVTMRNNHLRILNTQGTFVFIFVKENQ